VNETQITITKETMNFEGGIVPIGARYYKSIVSHNGKQHHQIFYRNAAEIPIELIVRNYGIQNISWPNKTRDMKPGKHNRTIIGRRAITDNGGYIAYYPS
jgi:hypothetical protein